MKLRTHPGFYAQTLIAIVLIATASTAWGEVLPAFPTAEGFGATAVGGRGGDVYHVSNLNDDGPGSLRHGINTASGPTTIVFDVGGTIELQSTLAIAKSQLTIAGQTAPGGIAVAGHSTQIINASDVVVRYMSFRAGDRNIGSVGDSVRVVNANRIMLDHISTAWGLDETLSVTRSNNVTVQHSIIAETLNPANHAYGSLVRGNVDAANPGGYTFHHNLWMHNDRRNPAVGSYQEEDKNAALELELINNVIFNWGARSIHTVESDDALRMNLVNNLFVAGPSSQNPSEVMRTELGQSNVHVYESGNQIDFDQDSEHDPEAVTRSMFKKSFGSSIQFASAPFAFPGTDAQDAEDAYLTVLAEVGSSLHRDEVDLRLIDELIDRRGGIIVSQDDVGGYPTILGGPAWQDSDGDGMSDDWEIKFDLDLNDPSDRNFVAANGYTNLENYLNGLTQAAAVPEPSTTALLGGILVGLASIRRRAGKSRPANV